MKTLALLISSAFICPGMRGSTFENAETTSSHSEVYYTDVFPESDSGTFDYYVNGVKVGTSSYEFLLERVLSNNFELAMGDAKFKGEIEYLGSSEMTIKKKSAKYHTYKVNLPPVYEMEIVTDTENNICIIYYKAQNGAFVKPGFEELLMRI